MNTYGMRMRGKDKATQGAKNSTRPSCEVTSKVRVSWSSVVVGTCVEIKLQAPARWRGVSTPSTRRRPRSCGSSMTTSHSQDNPTPWLVSTQIITLVSSAWPTMIVAAVPDGTMERALRRLSMAALWCFLCSVVSSQNRRRNRRSAMRPHEKINKRSKLHVVGVRRHVVGDVRQRRQVELPLLRGEAVGRRRLGRRARRQPHEPRAG